VTAVSFRTSTPADAAEIAHTLELAFDGYREIAPPGWSPPPVEQDPIRVRLRNPEVWCQVAEADGGLVGHVALTPASLHAMYPIADPTLAHLWQMFVRREHWGSGIATKLHSAVLDEARRREYREFRLYTPAGQLRARGFYEREGWRSVGEVFPEETLGGMELIEYRRPLT
jgi:GNAT superfamily N-acetyltransferase